MRRKSAMPIRRLCGCDAGVSLVEFALVVFPLILIALGAFDYFAASYEITTLEGAARGIGEYARDAGTCAGGLGNNLCGPGIAALFSTMQSNNNSLSNATQSTLTYYTCTDNTLTSSSGPCNVNGDSRVLEYIQVTVQQGWWKLFSWDPWSSTNKLTARMSTRIQ